MSGTLPAEPAPIAIRVGQIAPAFVSVTHSLNRQVRTRNAQRWTFKVQWPRRPAADMRDLVAFLQSQGGPAGSFAFALPTLFNRAAGAGTPLVNGASQVGASLITDGWFPGLVVLRRGDFLQLAGSAKVYQMTADATADGSGNATLSIWPPLIASPANNAAIALHELGAPISWTVALTSQDLAIDLDHCERHGLEIDLIEVA